MKFDPRDPEGTQLTSMPSNPGLGGYPGTYPGGSLPSGTFSEKWWAGMNGSYDGWAAGPDTSYGTMDDYPIDPMEAPKYFGKDNDANPMSVADPYMTSPTGNFGPHCRNCHRGSSDCGVCHENRLYVTGSAKFMGAQGATEAIDVEPQLYSWGMSTQGGKTSMGKDIGTDVGDPNLTQFWRHERSVEWDTDWRTDAGTTAAKPDGTPITGPGTGGINTACSNDGFSWPHRTMGFKLLKDELWGLDFDGAEVAVGGTRLGVPDYISADGSMYPVATTSLPSKLYGAVAQDLDSVCLDCHNPDVWNPTSYGDYTDNPTDASDDYDDELLLRGLP